MDRTTMLPRPIRGLIATVPLSVLLMMTGCGGPSEDEFRTVTEADTTERTEPAADAAPQPPVTDTTSLQQLADSAQQAGDDPPSAPGDEPLPPPEETPAIAQVSPEADPSTPQTDPGPLGGQAATDSARRLRSTDATATTDPTTSVRPIQATGSGADLLGRRTGRGAADLV